MNAERLFVLAVSTVVMTALGLWLAWIKDTERWLYFLVYIAGLGGILWRYRNYRPDDCS